MRVKPSSIWCITLALCSLLFITHTLPVTISIGLFIVHALILAFGITNLRLQFFGFSTCTIPTAKNEIFLTFDDGPNPYLTLKVLDLLHTYGYTATFFVIAIKAQKQPEIIKRIIADGHTLGVHDLTHSPLCNVRRPKKMLFEIGLAKEQISTISKTPLTLYRPPMGLSNPYLHTVLLSLGLQCVGFSIWPGDAGNKRPKRIRTILSKIKSGDIVLLHDSAPTINLADDFIFELTLLLDEIKNKKFMSSKLKI